MSPRNMLMQAPRGDAGMAPTALPTGTKEVGSQHHAQAVLPREKPGTHCIGGRVDLGADLDEWGKSRLCRVLIPGLISS